MSDSKNEKKLLDFDDEFFSKLDEYGYSSYPDIATKLDYAEKACDLLGIDYKKVSLIIAVCETRRCCYGEVGERFLTQKVPGYSEDKYLRALTSESIPEDIREEVFKGASNILEGKTENNEELLSFLTNYAMEYANTYVDNKSKQVFMAMYFDRLVKKSMEEGVLTAPKIDFSKREKRSKAAIEHKQDKYVMLNMLYDYYFAENNIDKIPEDFIARVGNIKPNEIVAYFIASRTEKTIEDLVRKLEERNRDK